MTNLDKYKEELKDLIETSDLMTKDINLRTLGEEKKSKLKKEYKNLLKK